VSVVLVAAATETEFLFEALAEVMFATDETETELLTKYTMPASVDLTVIVSPFFAIDFASILETVGAVVSASGVTEALIEIISLNEVGDGHDPHEPPCEQNVQSGFATGLIP
jgi:hypothetical protein